MLDLYWVLSLCSFWWSLHRYKTFVCWGILEISTQLHKTWPCGSMVSSPYGQWLLVSSHLLWNTVYLRKGDMSWDLLGRSLNWEERWALTDELCGARMLYGQDAFWRGCRLEGWDNDSLAELWVSGSSKEQQGRDCLLKSLGKEGCSISIIMWPGIALYYRKIPRKFYSSCDNLISQSSVPNRSDVFKVWDTWEVNDTLRTGEQNDLQAEWLQYIVPEVLPFA